MRTVNDPEPPAAGFRWFSGKIWKITGISSPVLHIRAGNTDQFTILGCCIIDGPVGNFKLSRDRFQWSWKLSYARIYLSFGPKCASNTYVPMFTLQIWLHGYAVQKPKAPLSAEAVKFRWGHRSKIISCFNLCNKWFGLM